MNALLTAIVLWLSASFDLPAIHEHPRIEFVPPAKIAAMRYGGLSAAQADRAAEQPGQTGRRVVVAVYHDATRTIYLPNGWTGATPAELSVLVHEMVHHLQNVGKLQFECPQQREKVAYRAQQSWLTMLGGDIERDFEIDPFTLLMTTECLY